MTTNERPFELPKERPVTRWFTLENPTGKPGAAGTANHGRKGSPSQVFPAGAEMVLMDAEGPGMVRRIWLTLYRMDPAALRGLVIEMYWEGEREPAVRAPLGDFFCHAPGKMAAFENACFASPEGRSFVCFIPMPFRARGRIVLVNESGQENGVYYEVDATLGDALPEELLYFHASWRRENPTELRRDMTILPRVEGKGRFLGCNLGVRLDERTQNFWWGEGEVKVYLDGDRELPTLCGTGTEDYIMTGYGQGVFANRYSGNPYISEDKRVYGFYRFHIPDPVYFYRDIRVTIQVMGGPSYEQMLHSLIRNPELKFMKAGDGNQWYDMAELLAHPEKAEVMERSDDWCATAYWYWDRPAGGTQPLPELLERLA